MRKQEYACKNTQIFGISLCFVKNVHKTQEKKKQKNKESLLYAKRAKIFRKDEILFVGKIYLYKKSFCYLGVAMFIINAFLKNICHLITST